MSQERFMGTVIWFSAKSGYGFIARDNLPDLFVHFSDVVMDGFRTLKKGQKVSFGIGKNRNDQDKAIDVEVLSDAENSSR